MEVVSASMTVSDETLNAQDEALERDNYVKDVTEAFIGNLNASMRQIRLSVRNLPLEEGNVNDMILRRAENTTNETRTELNNSEQAMKERLESLCEDILIQRRLLSDKERVQFDEAWCIDRSSGKFVVEEIDKHNLLWQAEEEKVIDVAEYIYEELMNVEKESKYLMEEIKSLSEASIRIELLHQFIIDLLGRNTVAAKIFATKTSLDFEKVPILSPWKKSVVMVFLVAINIVFAYFCMLKAYSKGLSWQYSFLNAYVTQMLLDILLFETIECLWINLVVPLLVAKEVSRAYYTLQHTLDILKASNAIFDNKKICMNVAEYFFVSHKLASHDQYKAFIESNIIKSYINHFPGAVSTIWKKKLDHAMMSSTKASTSTSNENHNDMEDGLLQYSNDSWTWRKTIQSLSWSLPHRFLVSFLVQVLVFSPLYMQRIFIRLLEPVLLTALSMMFFYLIEHTLYLILFILIVFLLCIVIYRDYLKVEHSFLRDYVDNYTNINPTTFIVPDNHNNGYFVDSERRGFERIHDRYDENLHRPQTSYHSELGSSYSGCDSSINDKYDEIDDKFPQTQIYSSNSDLGSSYSGCD
jgi:hypothetical protein